jgi:hypothetical protein
MPTSDLRPLPIRPGRLGMDRRVPTSALAAAARGTQINHRHCHPPVFMLTVPDDSYRVCKLRLS